jgi:outer membrane protein TolC
MPSSGIWLLLAGATLVCHGQVSFTSSIDRALETSPGVKIAEEDLKKASAALSEAKDAYIPSVSANAGLGASSGITLSVPTIFTVSAQSLVFNFSQRYSIRAAKLSVEAVRQALIDIRQQVEEDAATTYITLDTARRRQSIMADEYGNSLTLVSIAEQRFAAGVDSELEVKRARRTSVQIRLQQLKLEDQVASLSDHLARLMGLPKNRLDTVSESIPSEGMFSSSLILSSNSTAAPAVFSLEATAQAKHQLALGDSRYAFIPQVSFEAQYGRISPFNGASSYYNLRGDYNTLAAGVQIRFPFLDYARRAVGREAQSDGLRSAEEVVLRRDQQDETTLQLRHSVRELAAQVEFAQLEWEIARDELAAMLLQLEQNGSNSTPPMTPAEGQNARIHERQNYLSALEAEVQLRTAEISLLRQTGQLDVWLESLKSNPNRP